MLPLRDGRSRSRRLLLVLLALALAFVLPAVAAAGVEFAPPVSYTAGVSPASVALGDLDRDGDLDAVVANTGGNSISVFMNLGDGTFLAATPIAAVFPSYITIADLNGDGLGDLAVADGDSTTAGLEIYLNLGGLLFAPPVGVALGSQPGAIAAGDLDGDGDTDLAVTVAYPGSVVILQNTVGLFAESARYPVGLAPRSISAADLARTGRLDLVTANFGGNTVSVLMNTGAGFAPSVAYPSGSFVACVGITDLDGDGDADLVAANARDAITVQLNAGDGTFVNAGTTPLYARAVCVVAGDFDGDGYGDAAAATDDQSAVTVRAGRGAGAFLDPPLYFATGRTPVAIAQGDLDGDGRTDLVTADRGDGLTPGTMSVLIGGAPQTCGRTDYAAGGGASDVAVADFNGDGRLDLAAANEDNTMSVFLARGDGGFQPRVNYPAGSYSQNVAVGDFDMDSRPDIVVSNFVESTLSMYLNHGDGTFGSAVIIPVGPHPRYVTVADLNGDGLPDLATANYHDAIEEGSVSVRLNRGNASFGPETRYPVGLGPYQIRAGNLNQDENLDLVVNNYDGQTVSILLNKGDGSFLSERRRATGWSLASAIADFDHDGDNDLAVANFKENTVSILSNDGNGDFPVRGDLPVGRNPRSIQPAIIRGDPDFDLVVATAYDNKVAFLENDSHGAFAAFRDRNCAVGVNPKCVIVADLDGNGAHDLITANTGAGTISLLMDVAPAGSAPGALRPFKRPRDLGPPSLVAVPAVFALLPSRPNPARGRALIPFEIPGEANVELKLFDVAGRVVKTLASGPLGAGPHEVWWDGTTDGGSPARPGTYFYRLRAGGQKAVRALILHD